MVSSHYRANYSHLLLVLDFLLSPPSHNYDSTYYVQTLECICLILLTVSTVLKWAHPLTDEKSTERIRNTGTAVSQQPLSVRTLNSVLTHIISKH